MFQTMLGVLIPVFFKVRLFLPFSSETFHFNDIFFRLLIRYLISNVLITECQRRCADQYIPGCSWGYCWHYWTIFHWLQGKQASWYLFDCPYTTFFWLSHFLLTQISQTSKLGQDLGLAKKLWEISETCVKLKPEERHY